MVLVTFRTTGSEIEVKHLGLRTTARRSVTMQLDTHTFNGSVNNFTLSNDVDTNDAFVFYNGVCMTPTTDYAISGKIITFTFTPVANSQVMVRYLSLIWQLTQKILQNF